LFACASILVTASTAAPGREFHRTSEFECFYDPPTFPSGAVRQRIEEPLAMDDGRIRVPHAPGVGVEFQDWVVG